MTGLTLQPHITIATESHCAVRDCCTCPRLTCQVSHRDTDRVNRRSVAPGHVKNGLCCVIAHKILKNLQKEVWSKRQRSAMEDLWKKHWETFHHGTRETSDILEWGMHSVLFRSCYSHLEAMTDLVAVWDVALSDGIHKIEFEHGTTSGKRVVYVDGKEEIRKEWMFKLVGKETFNVGVAKTKATINIDAVSGFAYEYTLEIDGKSLKKYMENRSKTTNTWVLRLDGVDFRVVLEKDTMDVWCNGKKLETAGEFVDDGTETHFTIDNHECYIKAVSSGKRKEGIIHTLIVDDKEIAETFE
ncbi:fas apoptotic inhibitory molecule 1 isoform X1 [Sarcophilus harrisii]|uniref:fas apoptotic inhibitory molecule 1 isoform X1 n=2 Tax=Sarcophilus harrisii TaxID=9305 RepID=UPI001301DAFD|nr:fas apoptotic inhibitory molecule 1 isoform X1 [Sarcophilus harrisii]